MPNIDPTTQRVCLCEGFDNVQTNYGSACDIASVRAGIGASVVPFGQSPLYGSVSTSEGAFHLSDSISGSCHVEKALLYLQVFQTYYELCRRNPFRECVTAFRVICRVQDAQLYLDVFHKYSWFCIGNLQPGCNATFRAGRMDFGKQKLKTNETANVFQAYSDLCSRNVRRRCSVGSPHSPDVFHRYTDLCATRSSAFFYGALVVFMKAMCPLVICGSPVKFAGGYKE
nr:hypothetical protein [Tanacetum cinerariifolium]